MLVFTFAFDGAGLDHLLHGLGADDGVVAVADPEPHAMEGDAAAAGVPGAVHHGAMAEDADIGDDAIFGDDVYVPCQHEVQEAVHEAEVDAADHDRAAHNRDIGKRLRKTIAGFRDPRLSDDISILVTYIGLLNYLTAWCLRRMHERFVNPSTLNTSLILDLKFMPASPLLVVRQYIARGMLRPLHLGILASTVQWHTLTRAKVDKLHRIALATDGALAVRIEWYLEDQYPHKALGIVDKRRDDRDTLKREVCELHFCCADRAWTSTLLRIMDAKFGHRDPALFDSDIIYEPMLATAKLTDGVCDDLEVPRVHF